MSESQPLKNIVEAALLAAGRPLSLDALQGLFGEIEAPDKKDLRAALEELANDYQGRGIEVAEVASGWRIQVRQACSPWISRLWEERPARYSRALMETLALIAYRQPITRGEIEDIRGVAVSTNIVKTLMEREWIHVVGHRDVPGKPSLYGTTREFLDYFGLRSLDELPTLAELRDLDEINRELDLNDPENTVAGGEGDMPEDDSIQAPGGVDEGPLAADHGPEGSDQVADDRHSVQAAETADAAGTQISEGDGARPQADEASLLGDEGEGQGDELDGSDNAPAGTSPAERSGSPDHGDDADNSSAPEGDSPRPAAAGPSDTLSETERS